MPTISMFYSILILMYFYDDKKHSCPHIHAGPRNKVSGTFLREGDSVDGREKGHSTFRQ